VARLEKRTGAGGGASLVETGRGTPGPGSAVSQSAAPSPLMLSPSALGSARKPRQALPRLLTHDCLLAQGKNEQFGVSGKMMTQTASSQLAMQPVRSANMEGKAATVTKHTC
ncbi:hypothetical protein JOQ06_005705, partial [Pogonophryne albipinna]